MVDVVINNAGIFSFCDILATPAERIERIESERSLPRPDEVLRMAQRYKKPSLCNAYCARACPIGQEYVPEIKPKELPAIVLEMLATLNTLDRERGCLIDISADGSIDPDERKIAGVNLYI